MKKTANSIIEIFSIQLKRGTGATFHQLYIEQSVPLQKKWKVDLLAFGPSLHDEDCYFVVRHYKDLADRQQSQDSFYGSEDWKLGPREAILSLIKNYTAVVVPAKAEMLEAWQMINLQLK